MVVKSRCFAFHALITQARVWKGFWVENSTSLPIYPFPRGLKLGKSLIYKRAVSTFFHLRWHFKRQKSGVFWKASFLPNNNWFNPCKTSRLERIYLLISAITRNFAFLSRQRYIYSRGWENSRQLRILTLDFVSDLHNCFEFSQPLECFISGYANTKRFLNT